MATWTEATTRTDARPAWLFSPQVDLATFLGSTLAALLLLAIGAWQGWLHSDTPAWTWVSAVLLIDVAHVYATAFRVYFVPGELKRRAWLYGLTPLLAYVLGLALYSESEAWFWRALAYIAVFHFVRQQYGWVALYRAKGGERDRFSWWIDASAIYAATLFPLIYWHAHLPRQFWWFLPNDFAALPAVVVTFTEPLYWLVLITYAIASLYRGLVLRRWNPGKDVVVLTTALCWYLGIVTLNSDYAFTVTNVIIHGVPYMVLVYWLHVRTPPTSATQRLPRVWQRGLIFLATVWVLAYSEELLWDRGVWHERGWLFGSAWQWEEWKVWLVPLLAVPQLTHYILDGFIWRRQANPDLAERL